MALADVDERAVRAAADALAVAGHRVLAIRCDVAKEPKWPRWFERTVAAFGRLDAAFNNAGVQAPVAETADALGEDFDRGLVAVQPRRRLHGRAGPSSPTAATPRADTAVV